MRILRSVMVALLFLGMAGFVSAQDMPTGSPLTKIESFDAATTTSYTQQLRNIGSGEAKIWLAACCKICKKGKACGNSCINRSYTCRQPPGCACNG